MLGHKMVSLMGLFSVSRQAIDGYLRRLHQRDSDKAMILLYVKVERKIHPRMGCEKLYENIKFSLVNSGIKCGRDKLYFILRSEHMLVPRLKKFIRTTMSNHRFRVHSNLIKDLSVVKPEQVLVCDITYIDTSEGFMYLSLVTDMYSKRIMGYHLSGDMKVSSVSKALQMAISNLTATLDVIHHSDRGLQYCHPNYIKILTDANMQVSMTTKYDPYENAIAERVNGILKGEYGLGRRYLDKRTAMEDIPEVIWIYNNLRPHKSCGMLTPVEAHKQSYYKLPQYGRKRNEQSQTKGNHPSPARPRTLEVPGRQDW